MAASNRAMTLMELLLVIVLMAILTGLAIPNAQPSVQEQLQATARILGADLAYARSLAVTHNSQYRVAFQPSENRYRLENARAEEPHDPLPSSPFADPDSAETYVVDLNDLPNLASRVHLAGAAEIDAQGNVVTVVDEVTFGPFGETERSEATRVWLAAGSGGEANSISIRVNPVTGLATVEPIGSHPIPESSTAR